MASGSNLEKSKRTSKKGLGKPNTTSSACRDKLAPSNKNKVEGSDKLIHQSSKNAKNNEGLRSEDLGTRGRTDKDAQFKDYWEAFRRLYHQNWTTYKEGGAVDIVGSVMVYKPTQEEVHFPISNPAKEVGNELPKDPPDRGHHDLVLHLFGIYP